MRMWLDRFREEVVTVPERVRRELEVTRHLLAHPTRPVLLPKMEGGAAVGNLWSTRDRVARALNVGREQLLPKLMGAQGAPQDARVVPKADFLKHDSADVDLRELPIPRLFPRHRGTCRRNLPARRCFWIPVTRGPITPKTFRARSTTGAAATTARSRRTPSRHR